MMSSHIFKIETHAHTTLPNRFRGGNENDSREDTQASETQTEAFTHLQQTSLRDRRGRMSVGASALV
eukprot:8093312-Pyramimonas_sp.AAC.1